MLKKIKDKPLGAALCIGLILWIIFMIICFAELVIPEERPKEIILWMLVGIFLLAPIVLLLGELFTLIASVRKKPFNKWGAFVFDTLVFFLGFIYEWIYMELVSEVIFEDWFVQLYNDEVHTPVNTQTWLTVGVLLAVSLVGYVFWNLRPLNKIPPLLSVLCIGAIYLGPILNIIFTIQYFRSEEDIPMLILPVCMVLMTVRTILVKVREWEEYDISEEKISGNCFLQVCNDLLNDSKKWPLLGLIAMLPLLGVIIGILVLFGQAPDSVVRAFTETADWNLSQMEGPQNVIRDEHYLCTVAAGGHRKVVKPQRYGVRHGHRVIVNRQLCVANAFEQVLEERTPRFHKRVRHFYDTYGFPIAKLIKTKTAADIVYFIMKPLEWIFLIVIYLTDVKPENRIAVQYMGTVK